MSYKSSYTGAQIDAGIAAANTAVQPSRTVNGHALSADVMVTASDVGLGNVTNESKATMFSTPTFTGNATLSDGNLVIGTSGKGIDFSATGDASGMTSELLNDYEEGTWTPAYSSTGATFSYTSQTGSYVKIGKQVTCTFNIVTSNATGTITNTLAITGFPYTSANLSNFDYQSGVIGYSQRGGKVTAIILVNNNTIAFLCVDGSTYLTPTTAGLNTGGSNNEITGSITYITA